MSSKKGFKGFSVMGGNLFLDKLDMRKLYEEISEQDK